MVEDQNLKFSVLKNPQEQSLIEKVEPVVEGLGYSLRDLEVLPGRSAVVRIFLEKPVGDPEAIGIEDCSRVHEILGPMFDVWDPFPAAYTLEVSSPGEKPALRLARHFEQACTSIIRFETIDALPMPAPAKPRRRWEGTLASFDPKIGELVLEDSMGTHRVRLDQIRHATWIRDWSVSSNDKKKGIST